MRASESSSTSDSRTTKTSIHYADPVELYKQSDLFFINGAHINCGYSRSINGRVVEKEIDKRNLFGIHENEKNDILLDDLAVALKVFYDTSTIHKSLSFSLDPLDECNPSGPWQKKVFYPQLPEGTRLGEDLFEADFLMKQISMGVEVVSLVPLIVAPFHLPQKLIEMGLKPHHEFEKKDSKDHVGKHKYTRFWIENESIDTFQTEDKETFSTASIIISNCKMKVSARVQDQDYMGKLRDGYVQDEMDSGQQFAKCFTSCCEELCNHYSIFKRMKQITKAVTLVKWLRERNFPINHQLMEKLYIENKMTGMENVIPRIEERMVNVNYTFGCKTLSTRSIHGGVDVWPKVRATIKSNDYFESLVFGGNKHQLWLDSEYLNLLEKSPDVDKAFSLCVFINPDKEGWSEKEKKWYPFDKKFLHAVGYNHVLSAFELDQKAYSKGITENEAQKLRDCNANNLYLEMKRVFENKYGHQSFDKCDDKAKLLIYSSLTEIPNLFQNLNNVHKSLYEKEKPNRLTESFKKDMECIAQKQRENSSVIQIQFEKLQQFLGKEVKKKTREKSSKKREENYKDHEEEGKSDQEEPEQIDIDQEEETDKFECQDDKESKEEEKNISSKYKKKKKRTEKESRQNEMDAILTEDQFISSEEKNILKNEAKRVHVPLQTKLLLETRRENLALRKANLENRIRPKPKGEVNAKFNPDHLLLNHVYTMTNEQFDDSEPIVIFGILYRRCKKEEATGKVMIQVCYHYEFGYQEMPKEHYVQPIPLSLIPVYQQQIGGQSKRITGVLLIVGGAIMKELKTVAFSAVSSVLCKGLKFLFSLLNQSKKFKNWKNTLRNS